MQSDSINRIGGIIIIIIAVLALLLIGRQVPFGAKNSVFYVENTDRIYRILISNEHNNELELIRRPDGWFLDGDTEVRRPAIDHILKTIRDIRIKSPVSDEAFKHFVDSENTEHLEVRIYAKHRLIQSFHVYRNKEGDAPGIMKRREATRPFIVHIPGDDADPAGRFTAERKFWMPNTVFAASSDQIARVSFVYTDKPDSSFSIEREGRKINFSSPGYAGEAIDTMAVGRYLSYFNYIPFESYAFGLSLQDKDSVSADPVRYSIELVTTGTDTTRLLTWTRQIIKGDSMVTDTDRLWGSTNGGDDLFVIRYYDLDPLIKYPSYFISD
ncbi:MAG: hypothetical protein U5K32_10310 [Bacteroidales bacterium]|nr:hypothetical protein [Bacteroidales bacterium]